MAQVEYLSFMKSDDHAMSAVQIAMVGIADARRELNIMALCAVNAYGPLRCLPHSTTSTTAPIYRAPLGGRRRAFLYLCIFYILVFATCMGVCGAFWFVYIYIYIINLNVMGVLYCVYICCSACFGMALSAKCINVNNNILPHTDNSRPVN